MTDTLATEIASRLNTVIKNVKRISGGDINDAYHFETVNGSFFVKIKEAESKDMHQKEAKGLKLLSDHASICRIPKVIEIGFYEGFSFLCLEFIKSTSATSMHMKYLGRGLAEIHKKTSKSFGLDHNNYMGSLNQPNDGFYDNFVDFYWEKRILPQLKLAESKRFFSVSDIKKVEKQVPFWGNIFPDERPSLIHGDLWGGNYMASKNDDVLLIDPAVSYGHREQDIAMTKLFGGFSHEFYKAYEESSPLENGFTDRLQLYQLYPVLIHVNLFGGMYAQRAKSIIKKYS